MSELAHAEIGKIHATTDHRQRATRTIGAMQPSCIAPKRQQNPQRNCRGGVVGQCDSLAWSDQRDVVRVSSVVSSKSICLIAHTVIV